MTYSPWRAIIPTLSLWAAVFTAVSAQTVAVTNGEGETGLGYMLRHRGNCYVVLPRHVAGALPLIWVRTATPVVEGTASVNSPFWEGIDLSIAVARGEILSRCTASLDSFSVRGALAPEDQADLQRILPSGEIERIRMRIGAIDYLTIDAYVTQGGNLVYEGTSGAFLFSGDRLLGMAVQSSAPDHARFIRIEEIAMNLRRWLLDRGAVFSQPAEPVTTTPGSGFAVTLNNVNAIPVAGGGVPNNVLSNERDFVFRADRVVSFVFDVAGAEPAALSRISVRSEPNAGRAIPKGVRIQVSATPEGRLRTIWSGEMGADGVLDTGKMAPTKARRIVISILSASAALPVTVSRIAFD